MARTSGNSFGWKKLPNSVSSINDFTKAIHHHHKVYKLGKNIFWMHIKNFIQACYVSYTLQVC